MAMQARLGVTYSILGVLLLGVFFGASQPGQAASGSITIEPGETKYLSYGTCAVHDVLLWDLEISTLSTIFEYWLQAPDGTHYSVSLLTWGRPVDSAGEWKLGFHIDDSGFWSATVYYTVFSFTPRVQIESPGDESYCNQATLAVSGEADGFAGEVYVSLDEVHYELADLYLGTWTAQLELSSDGEYTVHAQAVTTWGNYHVIYFDSATFTLDTVPPEVGITTPANNSYVAGNVGIAWQCSDECGVDTREVKVDLLDWVEVEGNEYGCELEDGTHTLKVRVTDLAGNSAVANVTVVSDTVAPTVSLILPSPNAKLDQNGVGVMWDGTDALSGIDHYEVKISGGDWIYVVGTTFAWPFVDLEDGWYTVTVKAFDKSGNTAESSVSFGIYTSIWSANGPYDGMPLYTVIAAAIIIAALSVLLHRKKRQARDDSPPEEPESDTP
ncbi:MAG: Ig-like domain-containing protein [Thermoplasmata archaeon]